MVTVNQLGVEILYAFLPYLKFEVSSGTELSTSLRIYSTISLGSGTRNGPEIMLLVLITTLMPLFGVLHTSTTFSFFRPLVITYNGMTSIYLLPPPRNENQSQIQSRKYTNAILIQKISKRSLRVM